LGTKISEWVASEATKDWAKWKITDFPGLFVVKMPARDDAPARPGLEINPADHDGNPTKRRGVYIRSTDEMQAVASLFGVKKLPKKLADLCASMFGEDVAAQYATEGMLVIE
jgi:hypothetical protein